LYSLSQQYARAEFRRRADLEVIEWHVVTPVPDDDEQAAEPGGGRVAANDKPQPLLRAYRQAVRLENLADDFQDFIALRLGKYKQVFPYQVCAVRKRPPL
jgi:hypothetical protein